MEGGAVPLLVLCLLEPELDLKCSAASTLCQICKHTPELAQAVVENGAIAHLAQMIVNPDTALKVRQHSKRPRWRYSNWLLLFSFSILVLFKNTDKLEG